MEAIRYGEGALSGKKVSGFWHTVWQEGKTSLLIEDLALTESGKIGMLI
ncbi:MAG TPA: hypothetical protein PKZ70_05130 [Candidatus Atribacteria bacterium]|nr:hypothetical protein [Candidatus Atribacteria bacterium]